MAGIRLRHVERFRDRHGKIRYYFRRGKGRRIPLAGEPGSQDFNVAYQAALREPANAPTSGPAQGTFAALVAAYFASPEFLGNRQSTQDMTRNILRRFVDDHGHRLVRDMKRADVEKILAMKAKTPAAANNLLKKLRVVIGYGIAHDWRDTDPTAKMRKFREGEWHTWTDEEVAAFEARWPLGSRWRTAFALHLYTGQRRADVCHMSWGDVFGETIRVRQEKTGAALVIPIHPELRKALDAWPRSGGAVIYKTGGGHYTVESYGNALADAIEGAGLPARCVLHGVRKAAARRLAEAGCTPHQIQAITGHKTLGEVERYTRAVDQEHLARAAIAGLGKREKS